MFKNVAGQKVLVFAFDSTTNLPKTGDAANITAYVDIDFAGTNPLADISATEVSATLAAGYYLFDLTQAETNGDTLMFSAKSTTPNIVVVGAPAVVFPIPAAFGITPGTLNGLPILGINTAGIEIAPSNGPPLRLLSLNDNACEMIGGSGSAGLEITGGPDIGVGAGPGLIVTSGNVASAPDVLLSNSLSPTLSAAVLSTTGLAAIANAVWGFVIESTYTAVMILRGVASFIMNKASGGGVGPVVFRDMADTKDRLTMTVDANGNRSTVTRDLT